MKVDWDEQVRVLREVAEWNAQGLKLIGERTMARNWTTKTLAKELVSFIRAHPDIKADSPVKELIAGLAASILTEELELDLDPWIETEPTLPLEEG